MTKKRKFKLKIKINTQKSIFILLTLTSLTIILGFIIDQPAMLLISYFALYSSFITLFRDEIILNSIVAPLFLIFTIIMIADIINQAYYALVIHAPIVYFSLNVITRRRKRIKRSFFLISSILYANWLLTIAIWFPEISLGLPLNYHIFNYAINLIVNFTIGYIYIKKKIR